MLNRLAEEEVEGAQQDLHQVEESPGISLSWDWICFRMLNQAISTFCNEEEEAQQEKDAIPGQQILIFFYRATTKVIPNQKERLSRNNEKEIVQTTL